MSDPHKSTRTVSMFGKTYSKRVELERPDEGSQGVVGTTIYARGHETHEPPGLNATNSNCFSTLPGGPLPGLPVPHDDDIERLRAELEKLAERVESLERQVKQ